MTPKYEKNLLNNMMKIINYPHDKVTFFTRLKIRIPIVAIMIVGFIFWFYMFYYKYLSYYFWIEEDPCDLGYKFLFDTCLFFIIPLICGAICGTFIIYFQSKYTAWGNLKQYVDQDKILNRLAQLECETSKHKRKKR